jgi:hypothetical protein
MRRCGHCCAELAPLCRRHRLHKAARVAAKAKQDLRATLDLGRSQVGCLGNAPEQGCGVGYAGGGSSPPPPAD